MKTLEKSQDKIKKICEVLRDEALEPAKKEAEKIIQEAHQQAQQILAEAKQSAIALEEQAKGKMEQEMRVFQESLQQAAKQSVELLRQKIENQFFSEHLASVIEKESSHPALLAKLIAAIVEALEKEGLKTDLTALIPQKISPDEVNRFLKSEVLNFLSEHSVVQGPFRGGAKVRVNDKRVTIDISDEALQELLSSYLVRKDFKKLVFSK